MPPRNRKAAAVALLAAALCGCGTAPPPEAIPAPTVDGQTVKFPAAAKGIAVAPVQDSADASVSLPGRLIWDEDHTVRVFTPYAGRVARILARPGQHVSAGQVLAELVSPDFGAAQADRRKAQAALQLAEKNLARERDLYAHGVVPEKEVQQAEADHATAVAESERTQRTLESYGDAGDAVSQRLHLRSPIDGTVVERNLNPGQELRPDQTTAPLFVITDPTELWVELDAHDADLPFIHAGETVELSTNQDGGSTHEATLIRVADFVDPATRAIAVRGRVPNRDLKLRGEMYVSARIRTPEAHRTLVPAQAVFLRGDEHFLFVAAGPQTYTRRRIETGPELDGWVPVLDGVHAGESVVTEGGLYLDKLLDDSRS